MRYTSAVSRLEMGVAPYRSGSILVPNIRRLEAAATIAPPYFLSLISPRRCLLKKSKIFGMFCIATSTWPPPGTSMYS